MTTKTATDADGTWTEYLDGGKVVIRVLTAESPAFTAREKPSRDASATAAAANAAKNATALANIQAGVNAFRTAGAGNITNAQRDLWLSGVTWLLFGKE